MNRPDHEQRQAQHRVAAVDQFARALKLQCHLGYGAAYSLAIERCEARLFLARAVLLELLGVHGDTNSH